MKITVKRGCISNKSYYITRKYNKNANISKNNKKKKLSKIEIKKKSRKCVDRLRCSLDNMVNSIKEVRANKEKILLERRLKELDEMNPVDTSNIDNDMDEDSNDYSDNNIYDIEKILDSKKMGKKMFYLIKWEGYDETTWEPADNGRNGGIPKHIIKEYYKTI